MDNRFLDNLKHQAEDNPALAIGLGAAFLGGLGKVIAAIGQARGSHAYARDVNRRIKRDRKR